MGSISQRFGTLSPLKQALLALEEMESRLAKSEGTRREPIAVIGMGCRFPGAADPASFWRLLERGGDAVAEVPPSRWDVDHYYDANPDAPGKMSTRWAALLDHVDQFEPDFFGISPREAVSMDPQQRLLLEVTWEALENAAQGPSKLAVGQTGVFVGITGDEYAQLFYRTGDLSMFNAYFASGIARSVAAGRLSYTLGLEGPTLTMDTACSSSLVAVHVACMHLRMGECRVALAGGANLVLSPEIGIAFSKAHMMAGDGRCKAFDARADGFVRGEGCGMVVLKRLSDAEGDRDNILAVIRGSAVNQDGRSSGLTAPNGTAQEALLRQALGNAGVQPEEIGYVEAHGTGTSLGDPIEAHALAAVLARGRSKENPLVVGSVKTNVGHLEAAAGVAGLIKTVLALQHEEIPRHLHFQELNPHIDWGGAGIEIPVEGREWRRSGKRRIAGVSAFGFSGTNAHVIVEEAPERREREGKSERPLQLLTVTGRSAKAVEELGKRYGEELEKTGEELGDICYTANAGRAHFEHRKAVVGGTVEEVRRKLGEQSRGEEVRERGGIRPVFLFSGQGSQYAGMGKQLYETQAVFRRAIEECEELLRGELQEGLREVLWGGKSELLDQTAYTQPALFALEYGIAEVWKSWGILPGVVLGHSVGEYVAACVAGAYSVGDGLKLIAARARLMQAVGGRGGMVAVRGSEERVREALEGLEERVTIGAFNGRGRVVISGYAEEVGIAEERLKKAGIGVERLRVSHGFHSPQMGEMEEAFEREAKKVRYGAGRIKMVSSVTGKEMERGEMSGGYWRRQVREPVRFAGAMEWLQERGQRVYVEVGPGTTLLGLGREWMEEEAPGGTEKTERMWLASVRKGRGEWEQMLESLGRLYEWGAEVNWEQFDEGNGRRRVAWPTYPFERQRYWVNTTPAQKIASPTQDNGGHPLLGRKFEIAGSAGVCAWEHQVSIKDLPYLGDHRAFGNAVFPLTGYLEMMVAALGTSGTGKIQLREIVVYDPLILLADEAKTVQVVLSGEAIEVYSRHQDSWKLHCSARVGSPPQQVPGNLLSELQNRIRSNVAVESFYASIAERGMDFGPAFRCIRNIWTSSGESLVHVVKPDEDPGEYRIHPALFDGCLQSIGAALPDGDGALYLPVAVQQFELFKTAGRSLWAHARMRQGGPAAAPLTFDIALFDEEGSAVAQVRGLEMRASTLKSLQRHLKAHHENPLFEMRWEIKKAAEPAVGLVGDWLIFADKDGVGNELAQRLTAFGGRCRVIEEYTDLNTLGHKAWRGVIQCRGLDAPATDSLTTGALMASQRLICETTVDLIKHLANHSTATVPRLWLVTRGAQSVGAKQQAIGIAQSTLWGMAQAISEEHPELRCVCADLDPDLSAEWIESLLAEICSPKIEEQVAFRDGERYAARLAVKPMQEGLDVPQRVTVSSRGVLDNIRCVPAHRRLVPPGSVEIQVDAAGLNFRDVLSVLGMYPGDSGALGSECAGHIVAVGQGVTGFLEGDDVIALAMAGGQDGFVIADARLVCLKPKNLTPEKSATLPTAFLTVRYTLEHLAKIKPGDRVLIHAATGAVGLAAVQIAQRAKAEIYATAGSERKRSFLRSLGITHVMNSRTVDFAREVLEQTGGRGVDIVLNSLTGEAIAASFSVMAPRGRFLEIGKKDIWTKEQVAALAREIEYHVVDLALVARESPEVLGKLLRDTVAAVQRGGLRSLPCEIFSFRDAASAYRHMAKALHIGKIVLRQSTCGARVSGNATYLIAGGFGGLGLRLARWMVSRGAGNVVLVGRRGPNVESREVMVWAEAQGARIVGRKADISRQADVTGILSEIAQTMPPLRGIIHAAGVLEDGILTQQDWTRFERVFAPKVAGSWNLHELTASLPLDFFILFSSMATVLGAPGQANYAAANAFQDALVHERRLHGLPAISIDWGAWAEGMALGDGLGDRRARSGLTPMSSDEALALLDYILLDNSVQVGAGYIDWQQFLGRFGNAPTPKRFSNFSGKARTAENGTPVQNQFLERLNAAPESSRIGMLREHIEALALRVLGFSPNLRIDSERPLSELGLDSLMAVEFRNSLASSLKQSLPSTLLFGHPAIGDVTTYIGSLLFGSKSDSAATQNVQSDDVLDNVEDLSDDEVDRLLAKKMEGVQ